MPATTPAVRSPRSLLPISHSRASEEGDQLPKTARIFFFKKGMVEEPRREGGELYLQRLQAPHSERINR